MAIDSVAKLRAVYRPPRARSGLKVLDHLDVHCRNFIALSPLCVISSSRADGRADASPRGDLPGSLAHVLDDRTLLIPDRPGNRQLDTLTNLVERPYVGLVFFVPGWNETLRINGRVEIVSEREFLAPLAIRGKLPILVLKVTVEQAYLHCAKALIRARIWEPEARVERSRFPTYGQVLADQIAGADAGEIDADSAQSARTDLY
ncbi:MAG: pyridoxamine 5'-phosphate oxidase family protein [Acidobacteria bacterium]|nr:pyridoxamine 5'-phosphate oxidase family protein [Acidobacteriota bacterium]MYH31750.1 pyridoxamine 5'-phosphate oxidase family protein [Acidobacteriota bacterium]MYK88742.1 pyridoxamine 5'-phosphate oxidase family protein [Acidobacteriota bacterium]